MWYYDNGVFETAITAGTADTDNKQSGKRLR